MMDALIHVAFEAGLVKVDVVIASPYGAVGVVVSLGVTARHSNRR